MSSAHVWAEEFVLSRRPGRARSTECNDVVFGAYNDLKSIREALKILKEKKGQCEEILRRALSGAEELTYGGKVIVTLKDTKPSLKFDVKAFRQTWPERAAHYLRPVKASKRLLIK